jgi:heat shock protein HtpX
MVVYNQIAKNVTKTWLYIVISSAILFGVGWFLSYYYQDQQILVLGAMVSFGSIVVSYWFSDKIVLGLSGARHIVEKKDFPELYRIAENLAITAGLPTPKIYVINDPQPNAFATGRDKDHAVIAVTAGLLEILDKQELEGVMAHELSHIGNRDMLLSAVVAVIVGLIAFISDWFIRFSRFNRKDRDDNRRGNDIMFIIGLIGMILAPIVATLIQLAVSRKREFLADANAVLLTRYPEGLAGALEKISQSPYLSRYAHQATANMYIADPFKADAPGGQRTPWLQRIFSTHPPVGERIAALTKMM